MDWGRLHQKYKEIQSIIDQIFDYNNNHFRDGPDLEDLYDVTLKMALPRENLLIGRRFKHVLVDLDEHHITIYYKNNKSSRIYFQEITLFSELKTDF